jgi:hypothetical protein
MRIKGFNIGKSKEKNGKDAAKTEDNTAEQIVEMEGKINGRTKNLEDTAQQLKKLSGEAENADGDKEVIVGPHPPLDELTVDPDDVQADDEVLSVGPHPPLDELSIEPEDKLAEIDADVDTDLLEEDAEEIKVVEVVAGSKPAAEVEKEPKVEDIGNDSINSLFSDEEDDENPLANLIKSLPDVTAQELVDDLEEIQGIIKEWQKG